MNSVQPPITRRRQARPFTVAAGLALGATLLAGQVLAQGQAAPARPAAAPASASARPAPCTPSQGLGFVCGLDAPEDLAPVPGTRWLIASGMKAGGGLQFIDTRAKAARPAWRTGTAAVKADTARYASCPGPVDPAQAIFHGLAVRPATAGSFTVYATNHGGRETVEVFRLDGAGATPSLTWVGCIPMPDKLQANSVAAFPDGSLLATVVMLPGFGFGDMFAGKNTGAIFSWAPGQAGFTRLAGTDLPGPNGVETSADGREFYVALSGVRRIVAFTRNPVKLVRTAQLSGFVPDNVRLVSGRLFTAGMVDDEKACGGAPKEPKDIQCPRGHIAVSLDPATLSQTEIARGLVAPPYTGTAIAIPMGNELWLSSLNTDRIAWRPLK